MKVLAFSGFYLPGYKGGGPIKTLKNLFDYTGDEIVFNLMTSDRDLGDSSPYKNIIRDGWNRVGKASVFYVSSGGKGYLQIARELLAGDYDVVYLNGFFSPRFSFYPLMLAKMLRRKVVLAPRGEFSDGALAIKKTKKSLFLFVYKFFSLYKGTVFQASTKFEAEDIRRVLGSGVDICIAENIGSQEFAGQLEARSAAIPLRIVFLSRISQKKNLFVALKVLQKVQHPVIFDIFGPIEDQEYWKKCENQIDMLPGRVRASYKGALKPEDVVHTLANYDVFFLPTKGENFGHVIAEALCAGLPLLIADTTPWRNLRDLGLGWEIPLEQLSSFSDVLDALTLMTVEEHLVLRQNVLRWAKKKFSQRDAIGANIALFNYVYRKM